MKKGKKWREEISLSICSATYPPHICLSLSLLCVFSNCFNWDDMVIWATILKRMVGGEKIKGGWRWRLRSLAVGDWGKRRSVSTGNIKQLNGLDLLQLVNVLEKLLICFGKRRSKKIYADYLGRFVVNIIIWKKNQKIFFFSKRKKKVSFFTCFSKAIWRHWAFSAVVDLSNKKAIKKLKSGLFHLADNNSRKKRFFY